MIASLNNKKVSDLHEKKDSHISAPADGKMEWHLRSDDMKGKCKVGTNYYVMVPVVCTSVDKEATRLRQIGKPKVESMTEEKYD